ncbi:MAG: AAA family ATPase [Methyloprofundus sp.]|nr:AAA family ATPase [Methyloprofundus sp.]
MHLKTNTLYILSGLPGSGKSTFLKRNNIPSEMIISMDSIREQLLGTYPRHTEEEGWFEGIHQSANQAVFDLTLAMLDVRMKEGLTTFIDSTALSDRTRLRWAEVARKHKMPVEVLIFDTPLALVVQQNIQRERKVPDSVVKNMAGRLSLSSELPYRVISESNALKPIKFKSRWHINTKEKPLLVVGDVHGNFDAALNLMRSVQEVEPDFNTLWLGDFVNKGTQSLQMLDFIISGTEGGFFFPIIGNHEQRLVESYFLQKDHGLNSLKDTASKETIEALLKRSKSEQYKIINFLESLPHFYTFKTRDDNWVGLHANIHCFDLKSTLKTHCIMGFDEPGEDCDSQYEHLYNTGVNRYKLVRGHRLPSSDKSLKSVVSLENGSMTEKVLSAMLVKENGELRQFRMNY